MSAPTDTHLRVVVIGAGSGIGLAIARRLAAEGARVVVNDPDGGAVASVAAEIGAVAVAGDAASEDGAARLVDAAAQALGGIDVWFGNAGVDQGRGLDAAERDWVISYQVNGLAHVHAARLLVPRWIAAGGGRYVLTASPAGLLTMLGGPAYSVTKHGAVVFAEWLSATYRHHGIVVQAVCPLAVHTPTFENAGDVSGAYSATTVF